MNKMKLEISIHSRFLFKVNLEKFLVSVHDRCGEISTGGVIQKKLCGEKFCRIFCLLRTNARYQVGWLWKISAAVLTRSFAGKLCSERMTREEIEGQKVLHRIK